MANNPQVSMLANFRVVGAMHLDKDHTDFPENPGYGTLVLKDHVLYAYLSIGDMQTWYPIGSRQSSYVHTQGLPSLEWTINHALGSEQVWYQIQDEDGNILSPASFTTTGPNQFKLGFTEAVAGTVVVVAPASLDVPEVKAQLLKIGQEVVVDNSGMTINGKRVLTGVTMKVGDGTADKFTYTDADRLNFKPGSGIALGFDVNTKTITINATGIPEGAMSEEDVQALITTYDGTVTTKIGDAVSTAKTAVEAEITALSSSVTTQVGTVRTDLTALIDAKAGAQELADLQGVISGQINNLNTTLSTSIGTKVAQSSFDAYKTANDLAVGAKADKNNIKISDLKGADAAAVVSNGAFTQTLNWDFGSAQRLTGLKLGESAASTVANVVFASTLLDIKTAVGSKTNPLSVGIGTFAMLTLNSRGAIGLQGLPGSATSVAGAISLTGGLGAVPNVQGGGVNITAGTVANEGGGTGKGGSVTISGGNDYRLDGTACTAGDVVLVGGATQNNSAVGDKGGNVILKTSTIAAPLTAGSVQVTDYNGNKIAEFSDNLIKLNKSIENYGDSYFYGKMHLPFVGVIENAPSGAEGAGTLQFDGTSLYVVNNAGVRRKLAFIDDAIDGGTF